MQKECCDVLEVMKFDLIEETVGSWLRAIIRRLEEERKSIRGNQQKPPTPRREITLNASLPEAPLKSAKPVCSTALDRRWRALSISGRSRFCKLV